MSADMDTYSRAYAAQHLRNHAQPTGILTTEAELTRDQATVLAEGWQDSHQGTNKIQVLGKGAHFQPLSAKISDLEFLSLARVSRDQILSAYHVPASKLGLVEDSSKANGEEADRVYSALCLGPRLRRYQEPISHRLLPRLGLDSTRYAFEFDPVEVGDKEFARSSAETAFTRGAITLDEYREKIGFDPEANGNGSVYFVPMGSTVVENPETGMAPMASGASEGEALVNDDAARGEAGVGESLAPEIVLNGAQVNALVALVEAMMIGAIAYPSALEIIQSAFGMSREKALSILGPESNAGSNKPEEAEAAVERALRAVEVGLPEPSSERIQITALRFLADQGDAERRMKGRIRAVFTRMQKAVIAAAKKSRSQELAETRASEEDLFAAISWFNEELQEIIANEAERNFAVGHAAFAAEVAASVSPSLLIDFDLVSDLVKEWARNQAAEKIVGIEDVTKRAVRDVLSESIEANESLDKLTSRLRKQFDEWKGIRAETIARTETAGSYNAGKFGHADAFADANEDLRVLKTWVPTQDERTREEHRAENIQNAAGENTRTVPQDKPFKVGGEYMMRPLDSDASAKNVVRCRCVLIFDVQD
jgi:hypothetical protein